MAVKGDEKLQNMSRHEVLRRLLRMYLLESRVQWEKYEEIIRWGCTVLQANMGVKAKGCRSK